MKTASPPLEDDSKEEVTLLVEHRLPWLVVGLVGGVFLTILTSRFEQVLADNIKLAYFIPVIVYMAGAVGTQTETIYTRNVGRGRVRFSVYLVKEFFLGIVLGMIFGVAIGTMAYFWLSSMITAVTVGLAMFASVAIAPLVGLFVPMVLQKEHTDPALGGGPWTTVIQDFVSLLIYFVVASALLLR